MIGVVFVASIIGFIFGYDSGHSDGIAEACESIEYATLEARQLEAELRTCRISRDILCRKYNDLIRKIKAMEGVL